MMRASKKHVAARVAEALAIPQQAAMGFVNVVVDAQRRNDHRAWEPADEGIWGRSMSSSMRRARARNPSTQETVVVPAHGRIKFRPARELRLGVREPR